MLQSTQHCTMSLSHSVQSYACLVKDTDIYEMETEHEDEIK